MLYNYNFDVQSSTGWKALELKEHRLHCETYDIHGPTTTRDVTDFCPFITASDGQPTLSPPFPY